LELWTAIRKLVMTTDHRDLDRLMADIERVTHEALTGQMGFRLRRVGIPRDRERKLRSVVETYERLLTRQLNALPTDSIRLGERLLRVTRENVVTWGLRSHDAAMLAVAQDISLGTGTGLNLATFDKDFMVVDSLSIWGPLP
jgi:predicted nucleic acid-binding protein